MPEKGSHHWYTYAAKLAISAAIVRYSGPSSLNSHKPVLTCPSDKVCGVIVEHGVSYFITKDIDTSSTRPVSKTIVPFENYHPEEKTYSGENWWQDKWTRYGLMFAISQLGRWIRKNRIKNSSKGKGLGGVDDFLEGKFMDIVETSVKSWVIANFELLGLLSIAAWEYLRNSFNITRINEYGKSINKISKKYKPSKSKAGTTKSDYIYGDTIEEVIYAGPAPHYQKLRNLDVAEYLADKDKLVIIMTRENLSNPYYNSYNEAFYAAIKEVSKIIDAELQPHTDFAEAGFGDPIMKGKLDTIGTVMRATSLNASRNL